MKFSGEVIVKAPRDAVFEKVRDPKCFASCVEGVSKLTELSPERYSAILESKVAYMRFTFNVIVEVVRMEAPLEIEAKVEGTPLGLVGRMTATSVMTLNEAGEGTRIGYAVDAALTGKLGSLGQPVLRSKVREMEKQFAKRLCALFEQESDAAVQSCEASQ